MISIPKWAQSSIDPTQVSLTITSIGKAGAYLIVFLGAVGVVDPTIAGQAWSGWVQSIITGIPAGFAIYHSSVAVWGIIRKAAVRILALFGGTTVVTPPAQQ